MEQYRGFNPYYPGIQSETFFGRCFQKSTDCLFQSLLSWNSVRDGIRPDLSGHTMCVSILIILEFSQRPQYHDRSTRCEHWFQSLLSWNSVRDFVQPWADNSVVSFNPYYPGIQSETPNFWALAHGS